MMENHECVIGLWYAYEDSDLVTEREMFENIRLRNSLTTFGPTFAVSAKDYCDFRKSVNMNRFKYCPECGRKIDWRAIKMRAKKEDNNG